MSSPGEMRLLVLLGLRLKGFADAQTVAAQVGVDEPTVLASLRSAVAEGLVRYNEGRSVYMLDPVSGRTLGENLLAAQLDDFGVRDVVAGAYSDFMSLNGIMLQLCTDWQVREIDGAQGLNDHSDAAYDTEVIERLGSLNSDLDAVLAKLEGALDRYGLYRARFDAALERLRAGETDYFTKPLIASYHTVWFELHEDLLATLGIDRASEGST